MAPQPLRAADAETARRGPRENMMAKKPSPVPHPPSAQKRAASEQFKSPESDDIPQVRQIVMAILALVVGVVTGFGAVLFRDLIGLIHNALFLGQFAVHYDANHFTPPSPWGALVIL